MTQPSDTEIIATLETLLTRADEQRKRLGDEISYLSWKYSVKPTAKALRVFREGMNINEPCPRCGNLTATFCVKCVHDWRRAGAPREGTTGWRESLWEWCKTAPAIFTPNLEF